MAETYLIEQFINKMYTLSDNTKDSYKLSLKYYVLFLKEKNKTLKTATNQDINNFIKYRQSQNILDTTVSRDCSALKSFYTFYGVLFNENIDTKKINFHKVPRKHIPEFLDKEDILKFLDVLSKENKYCVRDSIIFYLMYYNGLKLKEVLNIKWLDVSTYNTFSKTRSIFISSRKCSITIEQPYIIDCLNKYINHYRDLFIYKESIYLFITDKSGKLNRKSVWAIMQRYKKQHKLNMNICPETIRSSLIIHKMQEGYLEKEIKDFVYLKGNNNFDRYVNLYREKLK